MEIGIVELKDDETRQAALQMALAMYTGETCPYCLKVFETIEDVKGSVWNGYTEYGRIAHKACFQANQEALQNGKAS